MKIKLNTGVTVKLFEPIAYLSDNALISYSNSNYNIAIDENSKYYILIKNNIVCGPTNWEDIQEFFNDLYTFFYM